MVDMPVVECGYVLFFADVLSIYSCIQQANSPFVVILLLHINCYQTTLNKPRNNRKFHKVQNLKIIVSIII
jgi:hypothetical protein